jgi:hypothetical protein
VNEKSVSELYYEHVKELERRALDGDEFATKSLSCMWLILSGWRYGDPDPEDGPDDDPGGGEEIIDLSAYRMRIAA